MHSGRNMNFGSSQSDRLAVIPRTGQSPNLAAQALAVALRVLPEQWHQHFGYRPLLAETFTDPEAYAGTLPVAAADLDSLLDVFRHGPDPRADNIRYRIGPVLTLVAMALLAGRREIAEIARFATTLTQAQHRRLGLPRKRATRRFYQVPGSSVFNQVLTWMDTEAFATLLSGWLEARAGRLPRTARDGIALLRPTHGSHGGELVHLRDKPLIQFTGRIVAT